jgi:hypothetical protein
MKNVLRAFDAVVTGAYKGVRKLFLWTLLVAVTASFVTALIILGIVAVAK